MSALQWLHSLTHIGYLTIVPYVHVTYPNHFFLIVLMGALFNLMDFVVSDSPHRNLRIINKNGISNVRMIVYMTMNYLIIQAQWIYVAHYILDSVEIEYYFDIPLLLKIIVTMGLGDIYFYYVHKKLHETEFGAELHKIHHCCYHPSLSTNLMFNPIDTVLEFTGPNSVLLIAYFTLKISISHNLWLCYFMLVCI
eukprot:6002_1